MFFAGNSARLDKLAMKAALSGISTDKIAAMKTECLTMGGLRRTAGDGYLDRRSRRTA